MANRKDDDAALSFVMYVLLGLLLMPIVGAFLIGSKNPEKRIWGWILLIAGVGILVILGIGSA